MTKKYFIYKVYTKAGVLVKTWLKDVVSVPDFTTTINGLPGQMSIDLARTFEEYGEDTDVKLDNRVDCYIYDNEAPNGELLYRGYISAYQPTLDKGKEIVRITLLPLMSQMNRYMLTDNGNTKVTYNSYDPSDIMMDIISKMIEDGATIVSRGSSLWDYSQWDSGYWDDVIPADIDKSNTEVSYTFNANTVKEAVDKCLELAPANWFYRVDPDDTIVFQQKPETITHDLSIGLQIATIEIQQRSENITNEIYFIGGGEPALYRKYSRPGSISQYGRYTKKIVDQRVTVPATADTLANKQLDEQEVPETRFRMVIIDNNGSDTNKGYNIESIKVGDVLRVKNLNFGKKTETLWDQAVWGTDSWDYNLASIASTGLLITKTSYTPNSIEIETSSRFPIVAKRIEDINRNLVDTQAVNNPDAPTEYAE